MRIQVGSYGNVYVIRDVWDLQGKLVTCQYATADFTTLKLRWTDCREGVNFSEIEPLVPRQ